MKFVQTVNQESFSDYAINYLIWSGDFRKCLNGSQQPSEQALLEPFLGPPGNGLVWPNSMDKRQGRKCYTTYQDAEVHACTRRSFFITESDYIGLGPLGIKAGDRICVLLGCDKPLIIR